MAPDVSRVNHTGCGKLMRQDLFDEMYELESTYWWHVAKRRLVLRLLAPILTILDQAKFLDIGCGTGMMMQDFSKYGSVFGVDGSVRALSYCVKRGLSSVVAVDLNSNLPFSDEQFDVVTMLDTLEHLDDDFLVLNEIHRVLKPGGCFVVTVPAYPLLWTYWDEILGHKRRYRKSRLIDKLMKTGFRVERSSYFYSYLLCLAIVVRAIKSILGENMKKRSDFVRLPKIANKLLLFLSGLEVSLIERFNLPSGLSIVCYLRKDQS